MNVSVPHTPLLNLFTRHQLPGRLTNNVQNESGLGLKPDGDPILAQFTCLQIEFKTPRIGLWFPRRAVNPLKNPPPASGRDSNGSPCHGRSSGLMLSVSSVYRQSEVNHRKKASSDVILTASRNPVNGGVCFSCD